MVIDCIEYSIYIDEQWDRLEQIILGLKKSALFILVDENTKEHCLPIVRNNLKLDFQVIEIPSGESHKNIDTCKLVWEALLNAGADRESLVINLGGGVIGDLGGFVASTYMRGISFIQIPTTLLAQVDASVGGKLGVDFQTAKNIVGLFNVPELVWINTDFLKTLNKREIKSGFAEVIKHSLLNAKDKWDTIKSITDLEKVDWNVIVKWNVEYKNKIVQNDFKESGERKVLNFGHNLGHAIESAFLNTENQMLHGEAIAAGMIIESRLSTSALGLTQKEQSEIEAFINQLYRPDWDLIQKKKNEILKLMRNDKKNIGGDWKFSLLKGIGKPAFGIKIEQELVSLQLEKLT